MTRDQTETIDALATQFSVCYIHKGDAPVPMGKATAALTRFLQGVEADLKAGVWNAGTHDLYALGMRAHAATNGVYVPYRHGFQLPANLVRAWAIQRSFETVLQPLLTAGQLVAVALQAKDDILMGVAPGADWHWGFGYTIPVTPERYAYHFELQNGALATIKHGAAQLSVQAPDLITAAVWADAGLQLPRDQFVQTAQRLALKAVIANGHQPLQVLGKPQVAIA